MNFKNLFFKNKKKNKKNTNTFPSLTILIPAYNECNIIQDTLNALSNIDYPYYKIIVVDDNSEDKTEQSVKDFIIKKNIDIEYKKNNTRLGKLQILNNTIPKIDDELILILDANIHLKPDSLKHLVQCIDDNTGIVYGNLMLYKNHYSSITDEEIAYWKRENKLKKKQCRFGNVTSPVGGFYLIKKNLFEKIPLNCNIEDMYILLKILEKNKTSKYSEKALAFEKTEKSTLSEFKRKRRILSGAFFILKYLLIHQNLFKLKSIDALEIFLNKVLRWIYPLIFLLTFIISLFMLNNVLANIFYNLNIILVCLIFIEYFYNSIINFFSDSKKVRVQVFRSPLYFYTLILAGISGFFMQKSKNIWIKDKR